jgi:hypothetical protein
VEKRTVYVRRPNQRPLEAGEEESKRRSADPAALSRSVDRISGRVRRRRGGVDLFLSSLSALFPSHQVDERRRTSKSLKYPYPPFEFQLAVEPPKKVLKNTEESVTSEVVRQVRAVWERTRVSLM